MSEFTPLIEMIDWLARPVVQALLNGLWQGMAVLVVVWLGMRLAGGTSASTRHAVWMMTLGVIVMLPALDLWRGERTVRGEAPVEAVVAEPAISQRLAERIAERRGKAGLGLSGAYLKQELSPPARVVTIEETARAVPVVMPVKSEAQTASGKSLIVDGFGERWPMILGLIWLAGVGLMSIRLMRSYSGVRRLRRGLMPAPVDAVRRVEGLARSMGIGRRVGLWFSSEVTMPMTIGTVRPAIVLPEGFGESLTGADFDSIMAHELAHIKRFDYLTNLLQRLAQAVLFHHPAVWLIGGKLSIERELACDDWAIKTCEPRRYASCLARLVELIGEAKPLAAAAGILFGKHVITRRVEMILNRNRNANTAVSKPALVWAAGLAGAFCFVFSSITPAIAVPLNETWRSGDLLAADQKPAPPPAPPAPPAKPSKDAPPPPPAPPAPPAPPEDPDADFAGVPALDLSRDWMPEDELLGRSAPTAPLGFFDPRQPALVSGFGTLISTPQAAQAPRAAEEARAAAIARAQRENSPPAIPEAELLAILTDIVKKDADPTVRQEALQGIYRMRSDAAISTLIQLYDETSDTKVRAEILGYLVRRNGDNSRAVSKLMSIARSEKDETLRNRAIRSLGYVKGDEGAANLIQIYDGLQDAKMKQVVIRYLAYNKSRKAIDKLVQIAKSDSDPAVRQSAVRGLYGIDNRLYLDLRENVAPRIGRIEGFGDRWIELEGLKGLQERMEIEMPDFQLHMDQLQDEWREKLEPELRRLQELDGIRVRPRLRGVPAPEARPEPKPEPKKEKTSVVI